jgi:hypothetical protein
MYRNKFGICVLDAWDRLLSDPYVSFLQEKYALFKNQMRTDRYRLNHIGFNINTVPGWIKKTFGIEESIITVEEEIEYDYDRRVMSWTVRNRSRPDLFFLSGETHISEDTIAINIEFRSRWTFLDKYISSIIFREMRSTFEKFLMQQC